MSDQIHITVTEAYAEPEPSSCLRFGISSRPSKKSVETEKYSLSLISISADGIVICLFHSLILLFDILKSLANLYAVIFRSSNSLLKTSANIVQTANLSVFGNILLTITVFGNIILLTPLKNVRREKSV